MAGETIAGAIGGALSYLGQPVVPPPKGPRAIAAAVCAGAITKFGLLGAGILYSMDAYLRYTNSYLCI